MNKESIMAIIANEFVKGAASTIVTNKSADSNMRKGTKANRNPYLGRVEVKTTYSGYVMGTDYANSLENIAKRMGNPCEAELKQNWHKPLNEWFNTDRKTESKLYLKIQRNEMQVAHKVVREWFVDGRKATDSEVEDIKSWLSASSHTQSSTQTEMGIDKAHEQEFKVLGFDTIKAIKQGDKVLHLNNSFDVTKIEIVPSVVMVVV